jgi:uncharacterized protein YrrD
LVVDDGRWYAEAKLLPFARITGLGESAVTTESGNSIVTVSTAPDFEKLLSADIKVIGSKVLTKTGRIDGKVNEIMIDDSGKIVICELESASGEMINLSSQNVVTYGKEVLIISDVDSQAQTVPVEMPVAAEPAPAAVETPASAPAPAQAKAAAPAPAPAAAAVEPQAPAATDESAKKFDEKHRKYLLGKKASRRIETDNGMLIVDQGGEITEEVLQKAKLAGKFVELSMNIQ